MANARRKNPLARPPLPSPPPEPEAGFRWPRPMLLAAPVLLVAGLLAGFFGRDLAENEDAESRQGSSDAPVLTANGELRQAVHEHADFAVYVQGQRLDFNRPDFLSTEDKELSTNVHIHAPRTNVVHIHREQTTWDEFFRSLGLSIDDNCLTVVGGERLCGGSEESLKFFVNGVRVDSLMFQNITDLSRVLISFGSEDEAALQEQIRSVSDEACIPGEQCGARIDPNNKDQEPCSKTGTSCVG